MRDEVPAVAVLDAVGVGTVVLMVEEEPLLLTVITPEAPSESETCGCRAFRRELNIYTDVGYCLE